MIDPHQRAQLLDDGRGALAIALERRARIQSALDRSRANGFDTARLRVDLARVEGEIQRLQFRE
ncbi:hypothetical protein [Thiorhodococcus minor]|uniref:Uncharacterized protein n=1 Tax=Thiorhodococcus minor TaxID=57489 RepID=A0A6M0JVT8_9GAMM|nr:hypothetical protein [Thiorhodococcus minor]NEV61656.1 hypothetical protein [Thiorhodococcus minor]